MTSPPHDPPSTERVVRTIAAAAVSTTLGTLPVFLLGALAVLVRADLAFTETQLGAAATVFFGTSTLCSLPAGRVAEHYGAFRATAVAAAIGTATLLGIALFARSYAVLLMFLTIAGAANAFAQLGSNLSLARGVPEARQGLAFGVKQTAIPVATLLGGLAVPLVGLTVGWRWAFAGGAAVALVFAAIVPRDQPPPPRPPNTPIRAGDAATGPLAVVAVGAALGAAATNAFGAFLVASAVASGVGPGAAGLLLAAGSGLGILMRLSAGWAADRRDGRHLRVVVAQLVGGALGLGLLATSGTPALVLGTLLGFGAGWSWPGLLNFAIVRVNRGAPAAATSITQTGVFAGGALGPVAFGATVEAASYDVAWLGSAVTLLAAAGLVTLGRRLLVADLTRRGVRPHRQSRSATAPR